MFNHWLKIVQRTLCACLSFPSFCVLCLKATKRDIALCRGCEENLPWLKEVCQRCALPLNQEKAIHRRCPAPFFHCDQVQALFDYRWPAHRFISQLKYAKQLHFARLIASLMLRLTPFYTPDCVIALPLHERRLKERGFNQSAEIAKVIVHHYRWPLDLWSVTRWLDTVPQSSLSAKRRMSNMNEKVFKIQDTLSAQHVLVIEDVITTGATVEALAAALKQAGVITVEVWSCCRTL